MSIAERTSQTTHTDLAPEGQEERPDVMGAKEAAAARNLIQSYSGYPAVQTAFESIVAANAGHPEHLTRLVREMVDAIEHAKQNPHAHHPVSAEIAAVIKQVCEIEKQKPDPLNLLRGQEPHAEAKQAEPSLHQLMEHPFAQLIAGVSLVNLSGYGAHVPEMPSSPLTVPNLMAGMQNDRALG